MTRRSILATVVAISAGILALAACTRHEATPATAAPSRPVHVAPVAVETLDDGVHAVGFLTPKNEARLSFKVGGVIETLHAEEGARVKAGQVLAMLRQTEIAAVVDQARQAADKSARDLARTRALQADGVATQEQLEDATTAAAMSAAALRSAEFNARYARIVAPTDGVVLRKLAEVSELVQAGQPIVVLGGADRGWIVRVGLADRDIVRVHVGDAARVTFDAWPGRSFAGRIANASSSADPATGTFAIEVEVKPDGVTFVQGLVGKVSLNAAIGATATVLPVQALVEANGGEASVFVYDAARNTVRRVTIRIGRMSGPRVEVLDGLSPGALVVIDGGAFLEDGDAVHIAANTATAGVSGARS